VRAVGDLLVVKGNCDFVAAVMSAPLENCFVYPEFLPGFVGKWD
jgi:hypothetical protein